MDERSRIPYSHKAGLLRYKTLHPLVPSCINGVFTRLMCVAAKRPKKLDHSSICIVFLPEELDQAPWNRRNIMHPGIVRSHTLSVSPVNS
jgi:hypothetical protein